MSLVVKIAARGIDPGGLISYLANNQNHHENQRIVSGTVNYPGPLDKQLVAQVAADLRYNQMMTGTVSAKGHVYHVSLSASRDNGLLSDARWAAIANDFMTGMRFTGPNLSPVRWTAINHGANGAGSDHIHLVMSTIRENGTQVSLHNDMVRASALATKLEVKYALGVMESRRALVGAGSVPFTGKEVERAVDQQRPEVDRVRLERDIRIISGAASSEAEFVRLVKADGLLIAPYPRTSGSVTGYSIAMPPPVGAVIQWYPGGGLAKDLTLPQLRRRWPDAGGSKAAALAEWRGIKDSPAATSKPMGKVVEAPPPRLSKEAAQAGLNVIGEQLQAAETPEDVAEVSHDLAATLAAASRVLEPTPGPLAKASREVGAWAQPASLPTTPAGITRAQARLLIQSLDPSSEKGQQIMLAQIAQMFTELHRLHQARRLVAAHGRNTTMNDDANPAVELMDDGTTVALTTGALAVAQKAQRKRHTLESQGDQQGGKNKPARNDWDASTFREIRRAERAQRETLRPSSPTYIPPQSRGFVAPRATPEQQQKLMELSDKVFGKGEYGQRLGLTEDVVALIPQDRAAEMINDYELAAREWDMPLPEGLPDVGVSSATAVGAVRTPSEADAFLAKLERNAEQRAAEAEHEAEASPDFELTYDETLESLDRVVNPATEEARKFLHENTDCAPLLGEAEIAAFGERMQAGEMVAAPPAWKADTKDPRNWESASDSVTKPQQYRLAEAGFSAPEIQALAGKGEASVVVAAIKADPKTARATYDRVLADAILDTPTPTVRQSPEPRPARVATPPSLSAKDVAAAAAQTAKNAALRRKQ